MSSRSSPAAPSQSDADSESSDSGVDTLSTSTSRSFPSDYMDLDEFLSVQTQNGQEISAATSSENVQNGSASNSSSTNTVALVNPSVEVPVVTEVSKAAVDVNSVLSSITLSSMSSLPLKVNPAVFKSLAVTPRPPAAENNSIIQWCQNVGVTRQETEEASGPAPGKTPVRRRRNAKYVYNPMPITKKADRKFVTQSNKDEKYWERRIKNNVAAKRSRDLRRQKEIEVTEKFQLLERENWLLKDEVHRLRLKATELEKRLAHFQKSDM